ncbi:hypothetical protein RSWS8N_16289 [Cereibacter sphaeroides WS8N]|uniref:hypothetical protein n=1 Tax=Cereibacter sphaeroides TaxID=1063 RepID=UPI00020B010E|nr:hypothetical protein [Cereibacter sphaeroides]EGJ19736.1 hypothetical protein RSWS8N_16289 [Cereibacter sphaeroides WS8N]
MPAISCKEEARMTDGPDRDFWLPVSGFDPPRAAGLPLAPPGPPRFAGVEAGLVGTDPVEVSPPFDPPGGASSRGVSILFELLRLIPSCAGTPAEGRAA